MVSYQVTKLPKIAKLPGYQVTNGRSTMKINCNYDKNCENCKHYSTCPLLKPSSKNHILLLNEISYWVNEYHKAKDRINEYEIILKDILNNDPKYSNTVNVYGSIKHYPKTNVFGVFIRKPEHVIYGWNLETLQQKKDELMEHIRMLNRKELNMRKILEKGDV